MRKTARSKLTVLCDLVDFGQLLHVIGYWRQIREQNLREGDGHGQDPAEALIEFGEVGVYHCVQRAVRRAWLCGQDPVTGKSFDHRKVWIQERLAFLAGQFAIDICSIASMSNHIHLIVRNRPDISGQWNDEEVARRWWNLFPGRGHRTRGFCR